ncbi:MAG: ABC transporter permease, partial [Planctomycetota bacterium]
MTIGWLRTLRLSLKSLLLHPLRSGLTVLGILIGVGSVIWLLAIGEGISKASQEQIASLGAKNIILRTIKPTGDDFDGSGYGLTRDDYQRLVDTVPTVETALPIREVLREFRYRTRKLEGRLVGSTPDYAGVLRLEMDRGRFLSDADLATERNLCVLAAETSQKLFPTGDAIGKSIMVDDEFYLVVGVAKPKAPTAGIGGSLVAEDFSRDVYIPITTF